MKKWKNPLLYLFSKEWQYSPNKKKVLCFWTMFVIVELIETFFYPLVLANIMDTIQREGINPNNLARLYWLLSLMIVNVLVLWAIHGPARVMELTNAFKIRASYRKYLLKGVITLPMEWHTDHHSGDTIDKIEKGTRSIYEFSEESYDIIYAVTRLISSYCMLIYFSHSAAYIVIIMITISVLITMQFDKVLIKQYTILNKSENKIIESVFDRISNITTVITLRVEKLVLDIISKKIDEPYELFVRNNFLTEIKWFLTSFCCVIMTVTVLGMYFGEISTTGQAVLMGNIYLLMRYLDRIGDLFFKFTSKYGDILKQRSRIANSELLSDEFKERNLSNHVLPKDWKVLSIKDLTFSYSGERNGNANIRDASIEIKRGQKIAFVGKRGSGKTTTLKIMRDLYTPQELKLSVDGKDIPHGFDGISQAITLIPQTPEIFASTIRENITLGADVEDKVIARYTDIACFTEVVEQLPKGLESTTKEKGVNLSGGQQQGLALARGLLACEGRDIILLDEPTSSLDKETERIVYRNILRQFPDKTIISTVHGLHLLPLFDITYVFDEGKIVGKGTVIELLQTCPQFQKLWQAMEKV